MPYQNTETRRLDVDQRYHAQMVTQNIRDGKLESATNASTETRKLHMHQIRALGQTKRLKQTQNKPHSSILPF